MTYGSQIHFDSRIKIRRTPFNSFDSISLSDDMWDSKTRTAIKNEVTLMISHDAQNIRVIDDLMAALKEVRQRLLADCESCQGTGSEEVEETNMMTGEPELAFYPCPACLGEGKVAPSESTAA